MSDFGRFRGMLCVMGVAFSLRGVNAGHAKGAVFVRWGSQFCPPHTTKLYDGTMAGAKHTNKGGGVNFICLHPDPQYPAGYSDLNQDKSNRLYGVKYMNIILKKNIQEDAACVVCQHNTAKSIYVQWGRVKCSNGHLTQYSGLIMASKTTLHKTESICVDTERAVHSTTIRNRGGATRLFTTEFVSKKLALNEQVYTDNREVACAVCSPAELDSAPTCQNMRGWADLYGDNCSTPFYSTGCIPEETVSHANKFGIAAKHACCACGGGQQQEKVAAPLPGPVVFTRWGSSTCPPHTTKLYNSFMAGSSSLLKGGGYNFLCMHPEPQPPIGHDDEHHEESNRLRGTQYIASYDKKKPLGDAACAVCQDNTATAVYVQWGRTRCSNGHTTQYSGTIMSSSHDGHKAKNVCVDSQQTLSNNAKITHNWGSGLYSTVMDAGASDEDRYPKERKLACAVCSPVAPTRILTHWGSRTCPSSRKIRKLYDGFVAGSQSELIQGGGANFLCMHPNPQHAGNVSETAEYINRLNGVEYVSNGVLDKNGNQDAACAVCEYADTPAVYVQWGRVRCSNGHTTQYSGLIMSSHYASFKAENICVDLQRAVHPHSHKERQAGGRLYSSESRSGAIDERKYPTNREAACAVCSANNNTRPAQCGFPRTGQRFRSGKEDTSECIDCKSECFEEADWSLKKHFWCRKHSVEYSSLKLAKAACLVRGPAGCAGVRDEKCDGRNPFRLCRPGPMAIANYTTSCAYLANFRKCGPLGAKMKYRPGKTANSSCQMCLHECFQALNWEKHANTICTRFTSAPTLEKALSLCQKYGPSKCAGVYASNCDSGNTMLCQPQTIKVSSSESTSSCIHTIKTTSTCGMPDIGKKFKSGQKYTSACKDCATECFEDTTCGSPPPNFELKFGKSNHSRCKDCAAECFAGAWVRKTKIFCSSAVPGHNPTNLSHAKFLCASLGPKTCSGVYDDSCDGKGVFLLCKSGYSNTTSANMCMYFPGQSKKCKPGQRLEANQCEKCGPGMWSSGLTSQCKKCPIGHYVTEGGNRCSLCFPGTYSNNNRDGCTTCSSGKYSSDYGLYSKSQCIGCPRGRYGGGRGSSSFRQCTNCPKGRYGLFFDQEFSSSCPYCAGGRYAAVAAGTRCQLCPKGHYRRQIGALRLNQCLACAPGQYGADAGSYSCASCPAGRYSAASATQCSPCPLGTRSEKGMGSCSPCNTCPHKQYRSGCFCHEGATRLRGGAGPWEGRVEMYTLRKWRPVCPQGFDAHFASLVCQSFGFTSKGFLTNAFAREKGPAVARRSLLCNANTKKLSSCRTGSGSELCPRRSWDVGVICCNNCEDNSMLKISSILYSKQEETGRGCHIGGSYVRLHPTSTRAAAHQFYSNSTELYLHKCLAPTSNATAQTESPMSTAKSMWVFARQKPPNNLEQCPNRTHAFTYIDARQSESKRENEGDSEREERESESEEGDKSDSSLPPARNKWTVSCELGLEQHNVKIWRDGNVRLGGGHSETPFQGRVEILHAGEWGSVCNTFFGDVEASVVCKSLGFHLGGIAKTPPRSKASKLHSKRRRVWMDQVKCKGREKGIYACDFLGWGNHNCGAGQEANVVCRTCRPNLCEEMKLAECPLHGCEKVSLRGRLLKGKIPNNFDWQHLVELDLSGNSLTGHLPDTMLSWRELKSFDVSFNQLSGQLSPLWGKLTNLEKLKIDNNRIKNAIPSSIGKLRNLKLLSVNHNLLNGTLPASLGDLQSLKQLHVSDNVLTGTVPSTFDTLNQLDSGKITGNFLTGAIPTRLAFAGVEVGKTCHPHRHGMVRNGRGSAGVPWCFANSICKFTCATDYIVSVNQSDRLQCFKDQTWALDVKRSNIECIGKPCSDPPVLSQRLQNQNASVTHCAGTASGESCAVICPNNHVLHSKSPLFQCWLGRWQQMSPSEASFMQCLQSCGEVVKANMHDPFTMPNTHLSMCVGTSSFIAKDKLSTGVCTFKCHDGYTVREPGKPVIQCVEGKWRRMPETKLCTPKPCLVNGIPGVGLPDFIRGRLKFPKECLVTESGQACRYQCRQPHAQLPYPSRPTIACLYGKWQLGDFEDDIRCVRACIDPPPKTLLKNAEMGMCKNVPALDVNRNLNGSCTFQCKKGMRVLAQSGIPVIRCESPVSGARPQWVKVGNTGECTSDLCAIENEKDNIIKIQNFGKKLWEHMYVPENVDQPATDMLNHWDICRDAQYRYGGTRPFRIGCCQKEIFLPDNGTTIIASGLFPLNASGTCPRRDNWVSYLDRHDFYSCAKIVQHTVYIYMALVIVTVFGILSGGMVILTKLLFGRKDVYKKIQKVKRKISILAASGAGRRLVSHLSANYKTTNSYKRGIESKQKKHLAHAANAVSSFETSSLKTKLRRQSSRRHAKQVVPQSILWDQEPPGQLESRPRRQPSPENQSVPLVAVGPISTKAGRQVAVAPPRTEQHTDAGGLSRVKQLHHEAERLREKNAAHKIQKTFRSKLVKRRFSRKNSLSRMTTKVGNRLTGAVHSKIRKYKKLMAGGYISINYTMLMPIFLATLDLISDLLFIWRLSNSQWRIGRYFLVAALTVLCTSTFGNFVGFFGIFVYSYRKGKVEDHIWKELMCPWLILIAITSLTHIGLTVLLPWRDREYNAHPTKCSYLTCTVLGYYEAFCQLCVAVAWIFMTRNFNDPITMISISFSSLVLVTGFYRSGLQAFLKAKLEAEKKTKEQEDAEKHLTMKDLKGMNAQLEKELKTLQDENRTLRILCKEHDSEADLLAATDMGLTVS